MKKTKRRTQHKTKKGMKYECGECGMVVRVTEPCGCADVCDLYCCGAPMKVQRTEKTKRRS
jgi:hypothetical protein